MTSKRFDQTAREIVMSFALLAVMCLGIVAGGQFVINDMIKSAIGNQTKAVAANWATLFAGSEPDIAAIAARGALTPWQDEVVQSALTYGDIYSFVVFDLSGQLIYSSDYGVTMPDGSIPADKNALAALRDSAEVVSVLERNRQPGQPVFARVFAPIRDVQDKPTGVVSLFMDQSRISAQYHRLLGWVAFFVPLLCAIFYSVPSSAFLIKRVQERTKSKHVHALSTYDQLTGVLNRHSFQEKIAEVFSAGERRPRAALCFLDVDKFKSINDEHGHEYGDAILRQIGNVLRMSVRPGDLVGRVGGDEFALLLCDAGRDRTERVARHILETVRTPFHHKGKTIQTTVSIGTRCLSPDERPIDALGKADQALYHAKSEGRNRQVEYFPGLEIRQARRRTVEKRLRDAISSNALKVFFQPIHSSNDRRLLGFEALVRMEETDGTPISPEEFVPIAEETGLIHDLSEYVLRTALKEALTWPEEFFVSVNLSPAQFTTGGLVPLVAETLNSFDVPAHRLELEITEGLLIHNEDVAALQLVELRAMGVSIAMDDFGTGYSSLGYLWRYNVDKIKVDRSFVEGFDFDPARYGVVIGLIAELGHTLDMQVTIEGLETQDQLVALDRYGCDQYQGYVFSKPLPPVELRDYIQRHDSRKLIPKLGRG